MSLTAAATVMQVSQQDRFGCRQELATIFVAANGRCWIECHLHEATNVHTEPAEPDAILWILDHLDEHDETQSLTLNLELLGQPSSGIGIE